jgi:hypothetical protein
MGVLRLGFAGAWTVVAVVVAACSSSGSPVSGADAGYCESNGYSMPAGGSCPKGTCMATGTATACCGSQCPTCESKGLVSYTGGGTCPNGLCPSADVTASLQCCDTCAPVNADAGAGAGATQDSGAATDTSAPAADSGASIEAGAGD